MLFWVEFGQSVDGLGVLVDGRGAPSCFWWNWVIVLMAGVGWLMAEGPLPIFRWNWVRVLMAWVYWLWAEGPLPFLSGIGPDRGIKRDNPINLSYLFMMR